jgi:oligopeptide transport system substrate-binding protein
VSAEKWWLDPDQLRHFEARWAAVRIDRRQMMKVAAAVGSVSLAVVAEACASNPPPAPTAAPAAPAPAAPAAPTTAPTTAAAAAPTAAAAAPTAAAPTATTAAAAAPTAAPTKAPAAAATPTTAAAAQPAAPPKFAGGPGIFRTYQQNEPPNGFDFNYDLYAGGDSVVLSGLLSYDPDYKPIGDMAEKWESNADGSVWTFHMRAGAKWSNGDPVTANDFEWSWKRQLDPATKASYAGFLYDIKNAQAYNQAKAGVTQDMVGVKAENASTLVVTCEGPRGFFPAIAAYTAALPAHRPSVEKYGAVKWTEAANGVWNGPYLLTKWEHNQYIQLDKNPNYWNAANISIQTVIEPIQNVSTILPSYENDELDWIPQGPLGELKRVKADANLSKQMITFSLTGTWYLVPSVKFAPFDDPKVRLAINHAVDRNAIVNGVLQGLGVPAYTFIPPGFPGYNPDKLDAFTTYDPKLAMAALVGTKYEGGKNWPKITLTQRDEGDGPKNVGDAIIQMLKQNLGMQIDHEVGEAKATYARMYNGEIQLMWIRWYADYPDPNDEHYLVFYGKITSGHRQVWDNTQFDDLVTKAAGVTDPNARWALYHQADQVLAQDGAATFVYYPYNYGLVKPWVTGMPKNAQGDYVPNWNIFVRMYDYLKVAGH